MMKNGFIDGFEDDWAVLQSFLPTGWEEKARELGALKRVRKFNGADALLRTLLIHLADGCSLRETVVRAKQGNIATISDVALLKRVKASGEWMRWMAEQLMGGWSHPRLYGVLGKEMRIRIIDGGTVQEPGAKGTSWRIHYSLGFPSLNCDEVHITAPKIGESFKLFSVNREDLFLGDRGYASRGNVNHVIQGGGEVLIRINLTNLPVVDLHGVSFPILERLRTLSGTGLGDWDVSISSEGRLIPGRICALKKSKQSTKIARRKTLKENRKKGREIKPETLEAAGYTFVFTTLGRHVKTTRVLEIYRGRWQIELALKRLKSIVGIGHLKRKDVAAAKAWIHGKLLVAFLIETLIASGERFSPWGYPIGSQIQTSALPMAGNIPDASFA